MFLDFLAKLGLATAATPFTVRWVLDEPECPKSLIK